MCFKWSDPVPRVVVDINVVVSALLFGGRLAWLRHVWMTGRATPIVCRQTTGELMRVLTYPKFGLELAERLSLLEDFLPFAEVAALPDTPPTLPVECRDRKDRIFLQLAMAAGADALVSGDGDLTALRGLTPVTIVSPAEFKAALQGRAASAGLD